MKRLQIIILLLLGAFISYGQGMNVHHTRHYVIVSEEADDGNHITNWVFDNGSTDWNLTGGWTIGSGVASFDDSSSGYVSQSQGDMVTGVLASTAYTLTFYAEFDDSGGTPGGLIRIRDSQDGAEYVAIAVYDTDGIIELDFTTPSDIGVGGISIRASSAGTSEFFVDSVKLVLQ